MLWGVKAKTLFRRFCKQPPSAISCRYSALRIRVSAPRASLSFFAGNIGKAKCVSVEKHGGVVKDTAADMSEKEQSSCRTDQKKDRPLCFDQQERCRRTAQSNHAEHYFSRIFSFTETSQRGKRQITQACTHQSDGINEIDKLFSDHFGTALIDRRFGEHERKKTKRKACAVKDDVHFFGCLFRHFSHLLCRLCDTRTDAGNSISQTGAISQRFGFLTMIFYNTLVCHHQKVHIAEAPQAGCPRQSVALWAGRGDRAPKNNAARPARTAERRHFSITSFRNTKGDARRGIAFCVVEKCKCKLNFSNWTILIKSCKTMFHYF